MHYIGTVVNSKGQENRLTYKARNENELRRRLEKEGYEVKNLKIDVSLEVAGTESILNYSSKIVFVVALCLIAAVVLSIPFPFVRKIWLREVWGYYGPINAANFMIVALGLRRKSVQAILCGLAVVFYELFLTWQGFSYFSSHEELTPAIVYFSAGVGALILVLLIIFLKCLQTIFLYYGIKSESQHSPPARTRRNYGVRCGIFALYLIAPAAIYWLPAEPQSREFLATLRLLTEAICLVGAAGIGYELHRTLRRGHWTLVSGGVVVFHFAAFCSLAYWVSKKLPPVDEIFQMLS